MVSNFAWLPQQQVSPGTARRRQQVVPGTAHAVPLVGHNCCFFTREEIGNSNLWFPISIGLRGSQLAVGPADYL